MTTAHRPTWKAAVGQAQEGGWSAGGAPSALRSVLDAPAHTKMKIRSGSQLVDKRAALQESLMKLEEAEKRSAITSGKIGRREVHPEVEEAGRLKMLKQTAEVDEERVRAKYNDADDDGGGDDDGGWSDLDDDGRGGGAGGGGDDSTDLDASDSDEDEDSDDEDEEAALQAELAKIRAEREAAKAKAEAEAAAEEEAQMEEAALLGNPLLATGSGGGTSGRLKRRWNDDVVFRNQAKGEPDHNKKRFINDTVRNDFHKRFLNKFVR